MTILRSHKWQVTELMIQTQVCLAPLFPSPLPAASCGNQGSNLSSAAHGSRVPAEMVLEPARESRGLELAVFMIRSASHSKQVERCVALSRLSVICWKNKYLLSELCIRLFYGESHWSFEQAKLSLLNLQRCRKSGSIYCGGGSSHWLLKTKCIH